MPRRVLIITTGGTPQVVTETLYALAHAAEGAGAWWPHEIVLATTQFGENLYRRGDPARNIAPLLGEHGKVVELSASLGLPVPQIDLAIACLGPSKSEIRDIRDADEVTAFADELLSLVRAKCAGDSEVHLSLAGGRKTMSYLGGAILSMYGRPQDRLSHVLVEPELLEGVAEFWWPEQKSPPDGVDPIRGRWTAAGARARFYAVPFVRLRAHLDVENVFGHEMTFAGAVESANNSLAADILLLDTPTRSITAGSKSVVLHHVLFATFRLLAEAQREGWPLGNDPGVLTYEAIAEGHDNHGQSILYERMRDIYEDVIRRDEDFEGWPDHPSEVLQSFYTKNFPDRASARADQRLTQVKKRFGEYASKIQRSIGNMFHEDLAKRLSVRAGEERLHLRWDASKIEIQ